MVQHREYKDSGIEWLGEIPKDWSVTRIKYLASGDEALFTDGDWIESDVIDTEGIRYLTTGNIGEGFFRYQGEGRISQKTFDDLQCQAVYPGDVVISRLNNPIGRTCIIPDDEPIYVIAVDNVIIRGDSFVPRYLVYAMNEQRHAEHLELLARGSTMKRVSRSMLGDTPILLPPKSQQLEIADYLDDKTAEIDSLIEETDKSIELLEEYRKSVISEAVTKGLDPAVPMKDSGIEWIGAMPEHWELVPISLLTSKIGSGKTPKGGSSGYLDDGVIFLRSQNVYDDGLCLDNVAFISSEVDEEMKGTRVYSGDVLLNITGGSIGRCCVYDQEEHANVNQHVCIMRPTTSINPLYLQFFWNSCLGSISIDISQMGQNRESINFEQIGSVKIPLPPKNEQLAIVEMLVEKLEWISHMKKCSGTLKDLLIEYRKSLISEVVTGKFKVPGVM